MLGRFEVFPKLELHQALGVNIPLGKPAANHCLGLAGSGVWVCVRDQRTRGTAWKRGWKTGRGLVIAVAIERCHRQGLLLTLAGWLHPAATLWKGQERAEPCLQHVGHVPHLSKPHNIPALSPLSEARFSRGRCARNPGLWHLAASSEDGAARGGDLGTRNSSPTQVVTCRATQSSSFGSPPARWPFKEAVTGHPSPGERWLRFPCL